MFMGVPYIPFAIGAGASLLLTFYIDMFLLVTLPITVMVMRQMARRDEMIFRLLGLRLQFRTKVRNVKEHGGMWVFSANRYRNDLQDEAGDS